MRRGRQLRFGRGPCGRPTRHRSFFSSRCLPTRQLRDLTARKRVAVAARFRPDRQADPLLATAKLALKTLAKRFVALDTEIKDLDRRLEQPVEETAPALVAQRGIGTHTAATLLVCAGDNPERLQSESSFAALTGTSPLEASSRPRKRHRLNRGGDRQANSALHMVAINRLANGHEPTRAYVQKRTGGTKADLDTLRRLGATSPERSTRCSGTPSKPHQHRRQKGVDRYRRFGFGRCPLRGFIKRATSSPPKDAGGRWEPEFLREPGRVVHDEVVYHGRIGAVIDSVERGADVAQGARLGQVGGAPVPGTGLECPADKDIVRADRDELVRGHARGCGAADPPAGRGKQRLMPQILKNLRRLAPRKDPWKRIMGAASVQDVDIAGFGVDDEHRNVPDPLSGDLAARGQRQ